VAAQVAAAQAPPPPPETSYARPRSEEPSRTSRARKTPRTAEDAVAAAEKSPTATALGAPLPEDAAAIASGKGKFVWPVDGQITGRFGVSSAGQKNDGVDIAAPLNTEVQAAADGEVVYAGSSIPAFGNLVLIKHADGWVTAYAHLARISVKNRASVSQGDTIGLVGDSGSPGVYQLHFEMRYAATPKDKPRPIDPTLLITR
jgi:murein DD-endopeptidase MepM/ murein hydrolase activator NlpD